MATTEQATTAHTETASGAKSAFPPLDQSTFPSQIFWLVVFFGLLYFLMKRILPRIGAILENRRSRIDGDLSRAQALKEETELAVKSYEKAMADARSRAGDIARETRETVTRDIDARQAQVKAQISARVSEAESRIAASKAQAMNSVNDVARGAVADIVSSLGGGTASAAAIDKAMKV
jgi:F-type H+-transporting ATPase subunit b